MGTLRWVTVLDALYWVCALVLVVSGASKLTGDQATARTLAQLGVPHPRNVGRYVGVAEVLVGSAALLAPPGATAQVVAVLVALAYAVFALVVASALREGLADCGCIGLRATRPTVGHVLGNLAASVVAVSAAVVTPVDLVGGLSSVAAPLAVLVAAAVAVSAGAAVALPGR